MRELTAVVDAARKADLSFRVSGEIVELLFKPGDKVKKGQVIARLDNTDYKIQLGEAQSLFGKAKADFDRGKQLIQAHTISRSNYDQLEAQYNTARANLDSAKNNLAYTQLRASFDGIIAKKYTDNHQQLNAREPVVALHDMSSINLKVDVPASIMLLGNKEGTLSSTVAIFDSVSGTE